MYGHACEQIVLVIYFYCHRVRFHISYVIWKHIAWAKKVDGLNPNSKS